ncbi:MAG: hypothetical protein RIT27_230 [Pseudomonadota bacterium]|jgi:hypothetical protein
MKKIMILLFIALIPEIVSAATEYATFEAFYKESSAISWIIAGIAAVVAGAVIIFTGGTASPIVLGVGTWIGGLMGYSGIVATNVGLALLGGGSIAAGGFGIIGGTTLLTAVFSFGTDIALDYTLGKAISAYQYSNLAKESKEMPTLPLPLNSDGSNSYKSSIDELSKIDKKSPTYSDTNQQIINHTIQILESNQEKFGLEEQLKNESLLSLLHFISNNYIKAKKQANFAIEYAKVLNVKRTLPAFIYATSALYDERFDFTVITDNYFKYSILAEPSNPLIPLLFSIYLDRMRLRFNDGFLDENALKHIFTIMKAPELEKLRVQNYTVLLARYFIHLKLEQQKISSLAGSSNETIKNNPKTLEVVTSSLNKYNKLAQDANQVMREYLLLDSSGEEAKVQMSKFRQLLTEYAQDEKRLTSLVEKLKQDQVSQEKTNTNDFWAILAELWKKLISFFEEVVLYLRTNLWH